VRIPFPSTAADFIVFNSLLTDRLLVQGTHGALAAVSELAPGYRACAGLPIVHLRQVDVDGMRAAELQAA
jgi:hypothetical protein